MNIMNYEPWNVPYATPRSLRNLHEEMSRLFGGAFHAADDDGSSVLTSRWSPAVDIVEEDDRFVLLADIPGVDPKDVEVTMENGMLAIRGERALERKSEHNGNGYRRVERAHGTFYRRFSLPDTANGEQIVAMDQYGVLEITIPKKASVHSRRIAVNS